MTHFSTSPSHHSWNFSTQTINLPQRSHKFFSDQSLVPRHISENKQCGPLPMRIVALWKNGILLEAPAEPKIIHNHCCVLSKAWRRHLVHWSSITFWPLTGNLSELILLQYHDCWKKCVTNAFVFLFVLKEHSKEFEVCIWSSNSTNGNLIGPDGNPSTGHHQIYSVQTVTG